MRPNEPIFPDAFLHKANDAQYWDWHKFGAYTTMAIEAPNSMPSGKGQGPFPNDERH
jgi:hypothetical protein